MWIVKALIILVDVKAGGKGHIVGFPSGETHLSLVKMMFSRLLLKAALVAYCHRHVKYQI